MHAWLLLNNTRKGIIGLVIKELDQNEPHELTGLNQVMVLYSIEGRTILSNPGFGLAQNKLLVIFNILHKRYNLKGKNLSISESIPHLQTRLIPLDRYSQEEANPSAFIIL